MSAPADKTTTEFAIGDVVRLPEWPINHGSIILGTETSLEGLYLHLETQTGIGVYPAYGFEKMVIGETVPTAMRAQQALPLRAWPARWQFWLAFWGNLIGGFLIGYSVRGMQ